MEEVVRHPRSLEVPQRLADFGTLPNLRGFVSEAKGRGLFPFSYEEHIGWDPKKVAESLDRRVVQGTDGEGKHLIVTLTAMRHAGDLCRGMLSVMAPKARISFVTTPTHESGKYDPEPLVRQIAKSLRADDMQVFIVDDPDRHTTYNRIALALADAARQRKMETPKFELLSDSDLGMIPTGKAERSGRDDKSHDGRFESHARGRLLQRLIDEPDLDHRNLRHWGGRLFSGLFSHPERYFSGSEVEGLRSRVGNPDPAKRQQADERRMLGFIRELPQDRREDIVSRLNAEDLWITRGVYYYGMAAARDYLAGKAAKKGGL